MNFGDIPKHHCLAKEKDNPRNVNPLQTYWVHITCEVQCVSFADTVWVEERCTCWEINIGCSSQMHLRQTTTFQEVLKCHGGSYGSVRWSLIMFLTWNSLPAHVTTIWLQGP